MTLLAGEVRKLLTIRTALWFGLASVALAALMAFSLESTVPTSRSNRSFFSR